MSESLPLVSIACITYNHESYIRDCIDGFLMQKTSFPIEIIIHDDDSTDKTAVILKEYAEKYPELIIPIFQTENQFSKGINPGFEYVFPKCKGKYIAVCEGDDYWIDPYKLQKQVDFLENNSDIALVYTDLNFYYQTSNKYRYGIYSSNYLPQYTFELFLISGGYIAPCTWLFKSSLLPINTGKNCVDGSFVFLLNVFTKYKIHYLNEITSVYRIADGSASNPKSLLKVYERERGLYDIKIEYCRSNNMSEEVVCAIHNNYVNRLNLEFNRFFNFNLTAIEKQWKDFISNSDSKDTHILEALLLEIKNMKDSNEYKLGTKVLVPYKYYKKIIKRLLRYNLQFSSIIKKVYNKR